MSSSVSDITSPFDSPTFGKDGSFEVNKPVGSMSISPCGRDVVLASRHGLHIVDLDSPWAPPRHLAHHTPWEVADVQWSPFPSRDHWVVSTSNQKALVWNLEMSSRYSPIELVIHGHTRALTDIQFSAHHPDMLATCAVDSFVHCWDLRQPTRPAFSFCDWFAGATQTKWNRRNSHIIASSHDRTLHIWDDRKGATPLRSLDAHDTKIYGIDWSRTDQNKIITCSLDKSIKFWDYSAESNRPERLLRTPFPVWRARHTPFGHGIVAMPQRGDFDVYLYDCREESIWDRDPDRAPVFVEKFVGHQDNVKEFLWRPRGSSQDGSDDREFQLVTWGSDHFLRLHHLDDSLLSKTGFERGRPGHRTTRRGAIYKTFRVDDDELPPIPPMLGPLLAASNHTEPGNSMLPGPSTGPLGWADTGFVRTQHGTRTAAFERKDLDPITWMKGVKIGKRDDKSKQDAITMSLPTLNIDTWDHFDNLGEEVSHVGQTFSKVEFNTVDINKRFIRMSLSGPWGKERSQAYLTCRIDYPAEYPSFAASVSLQETTSITQERIIEIMNSAVTITQAFAQHSRHSTEALIHFLQGEKTLDDLIGLLKQGLETPDMGPVPGEGESSSDEDELDPLSTAQLDELGLGGSDVLASSNANANVPLPKACGAIWTNDGRLLCFFPPKADNLASATASYGLDGPLGSTRRKSRFFDGFGRFHSTVETRQSRASSLGTFESSPNSSDSEDDSSLTSSSRSSLADGPLSDRPQTMAQAQQSMYARLAQSMSLKPSDGLQGSQTSKRLDASFLSPPPKTIIVLHNFRHILPSKRELAEYHYDGPNIGQQNADLTADMGFSELSNAWHLVSNLLAAHSSVAVAPHPTRPSMRQRARSGNRALSFKTEGFLVPVFAMLSPSFLDNVGTTAAKTLFEYFCQRGDIQMAAALSCALRPILSSKSVESSNALVETTIVPTIKPNRPRPMILRNNSMAVEDSPSSSPGKQDRLRSGSEIGAHHDLIINPPSLASSLGADLTDPRSSFSTGNTPPSKRIPKSSNIKRQNSFQQLKPSPSRLWQFENASGLIAKASNFASEISRLSLSASASPPSRKYPSPTISFNTSRSMRDSRNSHAASELEKIQHRLSLTDDFLDESPTKQEESKAGNNRQRPFKTSYRNREEIAGHQAVLSAAEQERLHWLLQTYRSLYSELLSMWRLPVLRAEVLKHNLPPSSKSKHRSSKTSLDAALVQEKEPLELGKLSRTTSNEKATMKRDLRSRRLCQQCGVPQWDSSTQTNAAPFRCTSCHSRTNRLTCVLCNRMLRGIAVPCLVCGHALHSRCRAKVAQDPALQGQCPAGCECQCAGKIVVEVSPAKKAESARLVRGQDSMDTLTAEVKIQAPSPTSREEARGHRERHQSFQEGEVVDARSIGFAWARESLARNLESRRTRARSVDRRVEREGDAPSGRKIYMMSHLSEWG